MKRQEGELIGKFLMLQQRLDSEGFGVILIKMQQDSCMKVR
jgi:hypothetical protein